MSKTMAFAVVLLLIAAGGIRALQLPVRHAGRFDDAHRLATSLISVEPNESRSHILLGDAAAGLDRRQEALNAYRRALAMRRPSYEEPTLLYERIENVIRRP